MFAKIIRIAFYLLFILVPLVFLPNTSELFEFNKIIITYALTTVIVAAWVARMIAGKRRIFRRTLLDIPLLLFLVFSLLSLVFSIDMHTSWFGYYSRWNGGLFSLISYALLYWAFVSNMDAKSTGKLINCSLITATLVAIWGTLEHFGIDKDLWVQDVQTRVFSTLGQPNWLAAYITALIFIPISKLTSQSPLFDKERGSKGVSYVALAISVLLFTTLLFTKSRSGLLAFGLSSAVYWGVMFSREKAKLVKPAAIFGLLLLLFTFTIPNPLRDLMFKNQDSSIKNQGGTVLEVGGTESGAIRKIVWTGATRIWNSSLKNLVIGTGPETFAMAYYQHRPIEHNQTSEWELLYNKAHNEFLNYLSTTGLLGLISYLLLLVAMGWILIQSVRGSVFGDKLNTSHLSLNTALFAGWTSIIVTNFWGFSVVMMQILLFLLPAFAVVLSAKDEVLRSEKATIWSWIAFVALTLCTFVPITRYWLSDAHMAASQKQNKYFQATQSPEYLLAAYEEASRAYKLNSHEPVIASELSNSAAYLALALSAQSTDSARQLAQISLVTSDQAIHTSPFHPNYYKSRARSLILLSDLDPKYLNEAANTLQSAMHISPTDPRLPYNLGVVYKYLGDIDAAKAMFNQALLLKSDFADAQKQLEETSK